MSDAAGERQDVRLRDKQPAAMNHKGANWIGGGIVSGIAVPVVASLVLAMVHALGAPVGDLREWPTAMIALWGPVFATIVVGPVGFALGAWAARRGQQQAMSILVADAAVVLRAAVSVGCGGAIWGGVLAVTGILDWEIGWVLVPVGGVAGVIGGALASWVVISDQPKRRSHAA